ncbi:MAG: hypothetical protein H7343_14730 [Undibacterium sp.]|nr:hypothetical protein [Opitutaceae bacterium]
MHLRPLLALAAALLLSAPAAQAMSVVPPTFPELVAEAESIVRGKVTALRSAYDETSPGRPIRTYVTFSVERTLKGTAPTADSVTLVFLGGTVGSDSLEVAGMPKFNIGDREIVFVARNGHTFCPLIGAGHGRYRVLHDATTQRDYVARENRTPLESTTEVALPLEAPAAARLKSAARALSPADFETSVLQALATPAPAALQN